LWQSFWDTTAWSVWFKPAGTSSGVIAAVDPLDGGALTATSWAPGHVTVLVHGTDDHEYLTSYENGWSPWATPFPTVIEGAPTAIWSGFQLNVFARGTDDAAHQSWLSF
jgi:hypothetical protein